MPPILRPLSDSPHVDQEHIESLIAAARRVRLNARSKYSTFKVGAALLTFHTQRIFVGTNVESADYDVTHAEESAISAYVADGTNMLPSMIVAVGSKDPTLLDAPLVRPCGKCREKIFELIRGMPYRDIDVIVDEPGTGKPMLCSIRELLPLPFFDASP